MNGLMERTGECEWLLDDQEHKLVVKIINCLIVNNNHRHLIVATHSHLTDNHVDNGKDVSNYYCLFCVYDHRNYQ